MLIGSMCGYVANAISQKKLETSILNLASRL